MDAVIMLALRIGLLALLWIFILVALNAMRRDTNKSAGAIRQQSKKVGEKLFLQMKSHSVLQNC